MTDDRDNGRGRMIQDRVRAYIREGLAPIPIPRGEKEPVLKGWPQLRIQEEEVPRYWNDSQNVGILTGAPSGGLVDVDLDCPEAVAVADVLLPRTGRVHGRPGNPSSHRWYIADPIPRTTKLKDADGSTLVEIRSTGVQTIVPPSVHPSGEEIRWEWEDGPGRVEGDALLHAVQQVAAVALLAQHWPRKGRHDASLALAGALLRAGWSQDQVKAFVRAICQAAGDEEVEDRIRAVQDTAQRLQAGERVTGLPTLVEIMGEGVVKRLRDWVAVADAGPEAAPLDGQEDFSDTGNADRLVKLHGDRLRYVPAWGDFLVWSQDAGHWIVDQRDVYVRELAKDVGRNLKKQATAETDADRARRVFNFSVRSLNSGGISGMVDLARGVEGIPLDHEAMDADGWLLGVANGVMDMREGRLRAADPRDLITLQCPVAWNEDAVAPRWEQAMREWFPDPEVRAYVQRVAGAALVGIQRDHVLIIHYGTGRNGKGTYTRAIFRALGPYASIVHLSLLVEQRHREHDTVRAALFRKRLAVASETQRRVKLDEASVKNLTGGDRITARRMREDPWEFDPSHSLWLQTNHLPEIAGRDRGIWSRVRVVKWEAVFDEGIRDTDLDETLAAEAPGILRWMVQGCLDWQEHGLAEPEVVLRESLAYRNAEDMLTRFETDMGISFAAELEISAGELQDLLAEWAADEGVEPPRRDVGEWLRENGAIKKQKRVGKEGKRRKFWVGVGIPGSGHESEQTDALS